MTIVIVDFAVDPRSTIAQTETDGEFVERTTNAKCGFDTGIAVIEARIRRVERLVTTECAEAQTFDRRPFDVEFVFGDEVDVEITLTARFEEVIVPVRHIGERHTILETNTPRRNEFVATIGADAFFFSNLFGGLSRFVGIDDSFGFFDIGNRDGFIGDICSFSSCFGLLNTSNRFRVLSQSIGSK